MTELIELIRNNIKPFNIGPVDAFRERINAATNIDDLISLRSSLERFNRSCSFPGLLGDYSFGRYVTEEWNVSVYNYILSHFRHYVHITSYAEHKVMIFPYQMIDLAAFAYQILIGIIAACVTANFAFGVMGLYYTSLLAP